MDDVQNQITQMKEAFALQNYETKQEIMLLKSAVHGSGPADGGIMGRVKETQDDIKKAIRLQYIAIGALAAVEFVLKFVPVNL